MILCWDCIHWVTKEMRLPGAITGFEVTYCELGLTTKDGHHCGQHDKKIL